MGRVRIARVFGEQRDEAHEIIRARELELAGGEGWQVVGVGSHTPEYRVRHAS